MVGPVRWSFYSGKAEFFHKIGFKPNRYMRKQL